MFQERLPTVPPPDTISSGAEMVRTLPFYLENVVCGLIYRVP
jgi:hypothetical protein